MANTLSDQHICHLKNANVAHIFPPPHPKRFFCSARIRLLRTYLTLDPEDMKCKNFFPNNKSMRIALRKHISSPYFFIIHPFSKANALFEIIFFSLIIIRYVTLAVKFPEWFRHVELVLNIAWFCFMLSFCLTGYVNKNSKEIYIDPKKIVKHYFKTYFVFDLIIFLKTPLRYSSSFGNNLDAYVSVLTVTSYLVRFKTVLDMLSRILLYFGINKLVSFSIYNFLKLSCMLHLITCSYLIIPSIIYAFGENSWLTDWRGVKYSRFQLYTNNYLLVVCYFFGADYEMDEIVTPIENIVLFLISFIGRLYSLQLLASVIQLFGQTNMAESEFEQRMIILQAYACSKQLPDRIKTKILEKYKFRSGKKHFNERQIMSSLTEQLRTELFLFGARTLVNKHAHLKKLPKEVLFSLFSHMESQTFLANEVIVVAGTEIKNIYFVSLGTVFGYNHYGEKILDLTEGDEFGMTSWLLYKQPQSILTWVAVENSEIYCVKREVLGIFFSNFPEIARYYDLKVKERFHKFSGHKGIWNSQQNNILSSLKSGDILEHRKKRIIAVE